MITEKLVVTVRCDDCGTSTKRTVSKDTTEFNYLGTRGVVLGELYEEGWEFPSDRGEGKTLCPTCAEVSSR